jgi:hypothetical protein
MNESRWRSEFELEEWEARTLSHIEAKYDTLALRNRSGKDVDELSLANDLARIEGIEGIKSLIVQPSSMVKNLIFMQKMPALETLQLYGLRLRSLDGLESCRHGRFIKIDTGRNQSRKIDKIAETQITGLSLHWGNPADLETIGRSLTIRELTLSNCPRLSLDRWRNVPIETMSLVGGVLDELAHTAHIGTLSKLILVDCRKLERFEGNNGNVTWMVIQTCNRLDLRTIATFWSIEFVTIVGIKNKLSLSAFARLGQLRILALQECNVQVDVLDLKSSATNLEKLLITGLRKAQANVLSRANHDVLVSNGVWSYKNGSLIDNYGTRHDR